MIYEVVDKDINISGEIYKPYNENKKLHILSILDIKKMIPVPGDSFQNIIFKDILDVKYRDLLKKEFKFCESIKYDLLIRVNKIYKKQKETGIIGRANCNFEKNDHIRTEPLELKKIRRGK